MRARLSLSLAGIDVELREVLLKDKPAHMLEISPKGTVPVLLLPDGQVLEESLDIMLWAAKQSSGKKGTTKQSFGEKLRSPTSTELSLIERNDNEFKGWLDRYKYHVGHPEHSMEYYREQAMRFLQNLDSILDPNNFSLSVFSEMALFPFVRQFAYVDKPWFDERFDQRDLQHIHPWLEGWLDSELFAAVMDKYPQWQEGEQGVSFPVRSEN